MKIFIIDGYNKTLFKNVMISYLSKSNNTTIIYLDDYIEINSLHINVLQLNKFKKKIIDINREKILYLIIVSSTFLDKNITKYIRGDKILSFLIHNYQILFLQEKQNLVPMNSFYCAIRINSLFDADDYFLKSPFTLLAFNIYRCKRIKSYYDKIFEKYQYDENNFFYIQDLIYYILESTNHEVNTNKVKRLIHQKNTSMFWKNFFLFLFRIIFQIILFLPTFLYHIPKFNIKYLNLFQLLSRKPILILPLATFILPSYILLFIPEIYNIFCLNKLYERRKKKKSQIN